MILQTNFAPSLDTISREVIRGLPPDLGDPKASDETWTKAIKSGLQTMGKARDLFVRCQDVEDHNEWPHDLVWTDVEDGRIVLAAEVVWGESGEIEADFRKLLSIKAYRKLLLLSTRNHAGGERNLERIEAIMLAYPYHLVDEEYMVVDVTDNGALRYGFKVPRSGRLDSVRFTEMGMSLPMPWTRRYLPMVA